MKEVKMEIDNGDVFYADEAGIMHNPLKLILDFRNVTPRIDMRSQEFRTMVLKHNVVMMDIFMAKEFLKILEDNIRQYEKRFGEIKLPPSLHIKKDKNESKKSPPEYFG